MSLIADPKNTFRIVLDCDKEKTDPPWFEFRYRSIGDIKRIGRAMDEIRHMITQEGDSDKLVAILQENIVNWGNQTDSNGNEVPFDVKRLEDIISLSELGELIFHFKAQGLTAVDRKNSGSQSPSSSGPAAKNVRD